MSEAKCSVCGISYKSAFRFGDKNYQESILLQWKAECSESLGDVLFNSYSGNTTLLREYFLREGFCSKCQQIVREMNFFWRRVKAFQLKLDKLKKIVCRSIHRNYAAMDKKTETDRLEEYILALSSDCSVNSYTTPEKMEMIYAIISKIGLIPRILNTRSGKVDNLITLSEIKEESTEYDRCQYEIYGEDLMLNSPDNSNQTDHSFVPDPPENKSKYKNCMNNSKVQSTDTQKHCSLQSRRAMRISKRHSAVKANQLLQAGLIETKKQRATSSDDSEWEPEPAIPEKNRSRNIVSAKKQKPRIRKRANHPRSTPKDEFVEVKRKPELLLNDIELSYVGKYSEKGKVQIKFPTDVEVALYNKLLECEMQAIEKLNLPDDQKLFLVKIHKGIQRYRIKFQKDAEDSNISTAIICTEENCHEYFLSEDLMQGHVRKDHKGEEFPFYCTTCPAKFKTQSVMRSHRRERHNAVKLSYYYFCKVCEKGYTNENELIQHNSIAHQGPNPFQCTFCETECTSTIFLIGHMRKSHSEAPFVYKRNIGEEVCTECHKRFMDKETLQKHISEQHDPENQKFKCTFCNKEFNSKLVLKAHRKTHANHVCHVCGMTFMHHWLLQQHNVIHTGELKHKCTLCDRAYKRSSQLRDHERVHSGIRAFICKICGKGFMTTTVLKCHEKKHEPGYVPRKPNRRNRPAKRKICQEGSKNEMTGKVKTPRDTKLLMNRLPNPINEQQKFFNVQQLTSFPTSSSYGTQLSDPNQHFPYFP